MATKLFVLVLDPGPPFDSKMWIYSDMQEARIGAVREGVSQIRLKQAFLGPPVVEDFLLSAAREDWGDAYALLPKVIKALGKYRFPRITVKLENAIEPGAHDQKALSTQARNLLSSFVQG